MISPYIYAGLPKGLRGWVREGKSLSKQEYIIKQTSAFLGVSVEDIIAQTRKREIVFARQLAMYFIHKYTKLTLKEIGHRLGGRDHSTVIHSNQTINDLIDTDKKIKAKVNMLEQIIGLEN